MKLALQIACHGNVHYLPHLLRSLSEQSRKDWKVFLLDNGCPPDKSGDIRRLIADSGLPIELFRSDANLGYAGGHNLLFARHDAEYVQILNDDAVLSPDYISRLAAFLERHPHHAAASGRILRWDYDRRRGPNCGRTDIIDSVGIEVRPWGAVRDRHSGRIAHEAALPDLPEEVFGVSGCLPMYRRSALLDVSLTEDIFDTKYASYKEDVDLAFRLQRRGWRAAVVHAALAWHRRSLIDTRRPPTESSAYLSYRNHLWNVAAYAGQDQRLNVPAVLPYEAVKLGWLLVKRPGVPLRALRETWENRRHVAARRRHAERLAQTERIAKAGADYDCDVAVLMVIYNSVSDDCLASLNRAINKSRRSVKFVVVDNGSTAMAASAVVWRHLPEAVIIQRRRNFGFGPSVNRAARELKARHYFIMNPDIVLTDASIIDRLADRSESRPDTGIVAPKTMNLGGDGVQATRRRFPTWFQPALSRTPLGGTKSGRSYLNDFHYLDLDHENEHEVDWVMGSAMMIPEAAWRDVLGFDERFFFYFEDVDLCRRVWESGRRIVWWPGTELEHAHAQASNRVPNPILNVLTVKATRLHLKGFLKYLWKWGFRRLPDRAQAATVRSDAAPKVGVIIPSFFGSNLYPELNRCLKSLAKTNYPRDRWFIVLAEDFSPSGANRPNFERDWSKRVGMDLPDVHHVSSERNIGFAGINNIGLAKAKEIGCDFVFLLNQDTEAEPDFLKHSAERAKRDPKVGIVQSLLLLGQDRGRVNSVGNAFHFLGLGYSNGYLWTRERANRHFREEAAIDPSLPVSYSSGAAALVRMETISQTDLFDERFFMYHEDIDLSLAARIRGWKTVIEPTSVVYHHFSFSKSVAKMFWMERNRYVVTLTYYRLATLLLLAPAFIASEAAVLTLSIRGGWWKEKLRALRSLIDAETWKMIRERRRAAQAGRRISDRELLAGAECRILFQEGQAASPIITKFANPLMCLTWRIAYFLIRW
jgi:hypothetical protein